eukprot:gene15915-biopygen7562
MRVPPALSGFLTSSDGRAARDLHDSRDSSVSTSPSMNPKPTQPRTCFSNRARRGLLVLSHVTIDSWSKHAPEVAWASAGLAARWDGVRNAVGGAGGCVGCARISQNGMWIPCVDSAVDAAAYWSDTRPRLRSILACALRTAPRDALAGVCT